MPRMTSLDMRPFYGRFSNRFATISSRNELPVVIMITPRRVIAVIVRRSIGQTVT